MALIEKSKSKIKIDKQNSDSKKPGLLDLIPYLKPYRSELILAFLALLVTSAMILFFGKAIRYIIDVGFANNHKNLNLVLFLFLFVVTILAIAGYYRSSIINSIGEKFICDLRRRVYSHILSVSSEFFEVSRTGDVISRLTSDSLLLYGVITNQVSFAIRNFLLFIGGVTLLFLTSVELTLVSLSLIPVAVVPIIILSRRVKNLSTKSQDDFSFISSHIEETINGIKTIQSYLCEEKEIRNLNKYTGRYLSISLQKIRLRSLLIAMIIAFAFGSIALVLWFGNIQILSGSITLGDLSAFIFYAMITATSLMGIGETMGQLHSGSGAAERLLELLEIESPVKEILEPEKLRVSEKIAIKFENVGFSYPSRKDLVILDDFSLEVETGKKVAIVGLSGSGKTTILQLLLRFYDANKGRILINGQDIKKLSLSDLRSQFAYISQDCFIFSGTIYENIAYAEKVTIDEVEKLVSENAALDFINKMPETLNCFVGEKGIKLSGGERQRIAIARAILKNSPILLLDEATSALDNENENSINRSLAKIMAGKTVITVAHKLSSIIDSDYIVFMREGRVAEIGNHKQLIEKDGFYKKMYEAEINGFFAK